MRIYNSNLFYLLYHFPGATEAGTSVPGAPEKTKREMIHERIGYNPEPISASPVVQTPPVQALFTHR